VLWLILVIPPTQEAEIRRITVGSQPEDPISTNKTGVVVHTVIPAMWEAIGRTIAVQTQALDKRETLSK
jgi:hypothetical protein